MSIYKRLLALVVLTPITAILMQGRTVNAAAVASDNACNSPYSGTSWTNGQNGGTGFGAWSLFRSGSGNGTFSFFTSSSGGINGSCGAAWGAFAGTGAIANGRRAFTGSPSSLQANQTFTFSIENGYVDNSGGAVGVALENTSSNTVWEFLYIGGNTGGYYAINDGTGTNNTPITYTTSGLTVAFTLTSSGAYDVQVTAIGGSSSISNGILKSPAGGQGISQFRFYNNEPLSGNTSSYNCFLNTISVSSGNCPTFLVSAPGNQSVCVGNTASFSIAAGGASTPTYQWQVSTNGGSAWNPVSSGTGGTTVSYTTAATVAGNNGNIYLCAVTDSCSNTVNSATATLTVNTGASIISQPTSQTGYVGGSVNFTVGGFATTYQWYKGPTGSGTSLSNGGSISGATTAALTLSGLTTGDNGANFYVVVNACSGSPQTSNGAGLTVLATADSFLKANGINIRNGHGTGDIVPLHGVNLGAWLLMEGWMCPMDSSGLGDNYSVISELDSRSGFGVTVEQSLIRTYQDNWITTSDLDKVRALGMNLVRVPFFWTNVQTLSGAWRPDAFDRLDWVVSNAWQRGIYTLIDFHGVPGGQSSSQDAGQQNLNAYWTSSSDQAQTALIWSNVAAHFVGNPAVAGYDLMNEPYGAPNQTALVTMYNNLYQTVRAVDPDHICMMEGAWNGTTTNGQSVNWQWAVLPAPSTYNWSNVVYSMHAYAGSASGVNGEVNKQTSDFIAHQTGSLNWNVPCFIGEFQGYDSGSAWQYAVTQFNSNGMSWANWAFKAAYGGSGGAGQNWGIYYNASPTVPNITSDSSTTISNDWVGSQTGNGFTITPYLQQYLGEPLAVADAYTATSGVTLAVNSASGVLANDIDINLGQPGIQLTAILVNGPANGSLILSSNGSFTYTPNAGFSGTDTFRYQVNDGYATSVNIATVVITVNPGALPPGSFQAWQVQYFGSTTNMMGAARADPYGKGISNTNQFLAGLNPTNPASTFQIVSEVPQGNNMLITWKAAGVRTNALQASSGDGNGGYTTNFANISGSIIINVSGDTVTNYTDAGGATNVPSRFYRVRLVP